MHKAGISAVRLIERDWHDRKRLQVAALHQPPNSARESGSQPRFRDPPWARHLLRDKPHIVNAGSPDEKRLVHADAVVISATRLQVAKDRHLQAAQATAHSAVSRLQPS